MALDRRTKGRKVVNLTGRDKGIVEVTLGMAPGEEREFEDICRDLTF